MNLQTAAILALLAVLPVGVLALDTAPERSASMTLGIAQVQADSLLFRINWTPAPREEWAIVEVGGNDGAWTRSVRGEGGTAAVWALTADTAQSAFACVTAWNEHPIRGPQEGGRRCIQWTIPADLLPPGQPGDVQVVPDSTYAGPDSVTVWLDNPRLQIGEQTRVLPVAWREGYPSVCAVYQGERGLMEVAMTEAGPVWIDAPRWLPAPCVVELSVEDPTVASVEQYSLPPLDVVPLPGLRVAN